MPQTITEERRQQLAKAGATISPAKTEANQRNIRIAQQASAAKRKGEPKGKVLIGVPLATLNAYKAKTNQQRRAIMAQATTAFNQTFAQAIADAKE